MKKTLKKIISILLCVMLMGAVMAPATYAAYDPEVPVNAQVSSFNKFLYNTLDVVIDKLVGVINSFIPNPPSWENKDAVANNVMDGTEEFLDTPAEGAYWSLGYANSSILTGNEKDGKHFVGGSLSVTDKTVGEIFDDLKVRTVALSDNSGRGTVVFCVIDAYGMSATHVADIREKMADYCAANNIVSLNISVLHQHSAVDTFGMNGSILKALGNAGKAEPVNGINNEYMANLYNKVAQTVETAVASMTKGTLYYGTADFSEYVTDKRDPQMLMADFDRFRFVPENGSKETWFTTSAIHCVGAGAGGTDITGDYPYYMEKYINDDYDANFIMMLGAELGTTQDKSTLELADDATTVQWLDAYGKVLADRFASIENETQVAPILNIKHRQVFYTITNQILIFAGKMGLVTNKCVIDGDEYQVVTEIGYMELGKDIAVVLVPGEGAAELFYGGCLDAEKSWTGTAWEYESVQNMVGDKTLIVFGIINDQIGYVIPDNDYMALLEPSNKSLELVATGNRTASTMMTDFAALIDSVK